MTIDTGSTIFGVIDGSTFINNIKGDFILKFNEEEIQGVLQDSFLAKAEEEFLKQANP